MTLPDRSGARPARFWFGLDVAVSWWMRLPLWLRVLSPVAIMAFLWWSSSRVPQQQAASIWRVFAHNSMHVLAYGALGAACWLAWPGLTPAGRPARGQAWSAWTAASLYGVVDELHQSFVPGRVCSFADLGTDSASAALATALLGLVVGATGPWRRLAVVAAVLALGSVLLATFGDW